jgi:NAD(P)-dependent dehydrogenase (short-subunit alcohol dehydrogenase family)
MNNRTVIITGANSGIGKAAALKFASEGYKVIMGCRNLERSRRAQEELIQASGNNEIELMELNMSSFQSIQEFCLSFSRRFSKLDILIHNAAHFNHGVTDYQLGPDHIELTFATNTFGPFLMTRLLEDLLAKSDDPRVLHACTTNIKHFFDPKRQIDFDNLQGEFKDSRPHSVYKMYGDSKMGLLMLTFKMAEALQHKNIKINAIQINGVKMSKETIRKARSFWRVIAVVQNVFLPQPAEMANNYYHICTADEYKSVTGKLFNHKREILQPPLADREDPITKVKQIFGSKYYPSYANDPVNQDKIWNLTAKLTEKIVNN